jgi:DNA-binding response OmpR family regulator
MFGTGYFGTLGISHGFRPRYGGAINLATPLVEFALIPDMAPILLMARSPLLETYRTFLSNEGFQTIPAADLAEVLSISQSRAVSLALLDIGRTGFSGLDVETSSHLYALLIERHIPLLLIFPGVPPTSVANLHTDNKLYKPFSSLEFSETVRRLVFQDHPAKRAVSYALPPILHTDDDKEMLKLGKLILGRGSYPVISTSSSFEVLRLCRTLPLSLIISDVMRPDMSGFELLKHVREEYAHHILFVFYSARRRDPVNPAERELLERLAPDDYLVKPCSAPEILDHVQRVLLA